jgi:hypothetical protein
MIHKKIELLIKEKTCYLFNDKFYSDLALTIDEFYEKTPDDGFVYFVRSVVTDYLKIGVAKDLLKRLRSLKHSNGDLVIVGFLKITNYLEKEKEYHIFFKEKNIYGEWFNLSNFDLIDFFNKENVNFVNKKYDTKILHYNDYLTDNNLSKIKENELNFENIIFDFFKENILLNIRYNIKELYLKSKIKNITQKKFTMSIQKYALNNGVDFISFRTHNFRGFYLCNKK